MRACACVCPWLLVWPLVYAEADIKRFPSEFASLYREQAGDYCCNIVSRSQSFPSPEDKLKEAETFQFDDCSPKQIAHNKLSKANFDQRNSDWFGPFFPLIY